MGGTSPMKLCVRSSLIFSAPGFNHDLDFLQGQKPVLGQALTPKLAVETLINAFWTGFPGWMKCSVTLC
jgi:hypothetical protein